MLLVGVETLTLQHPPRGHSSQPSSPVWIYMYPTPTNKQLNAQNFHLRVRIDNAQSIYYPNELTTYRPL